MNKIEIKRFNDINENFADRNTIIEKFDYRSISVYSESEFFPEFKENYSDSHLSATLQWSYELDTTSQGINGIITNIISVNLHGEIETHDEATDTDESHDVDINFNSDNCEFIINDKEYISSSGNKVQPLPYYPKDIEFEKDKETGNVKVTINFV